MAGYTSRGRREGERWVKTLRTDWEWTRHLWENEVRWLEALQGLPFVPELLHAEYPEIHTRYGGEPLERSNIPRNWYNQGARIILDLTDHECRHGDIKPDDLLVKDGVIHLVDYGWASSLLEPPPPHYYELGVGGLYRLVDRNGVVRYDDALSLIGVLCWIAHVTG